MVERKKESNNELVESASVYVEEVFSKALLFGVDSYSLEQDELVDLLLNELPEKDDDRDGWLRWVAISIVGFFNESGEKVGKEAFVGKLQSQLQDDDLRWGDTWKKRSIEGQLDRTNKTFKDYKDQFKNANQQIPWLKVAGNAVICLYRLDNPDYQK